MKMRLFSSFCLIALVIVAAIWVTLSIHNFNSEIKGVKKNIGEKIILGNDTLMIMDVSWWNNSYILSNGQEIDFDLLDKLEKVK